MTERNREIKRVRKGERGDRDALHLSLCVREKIESFGSGLEPRYIIRARPLDQ